MTPACIPHAGVVGRSLHVVFTPDAGNGGQIECLVMNRIQRKVLVKREKGVEAHYRVDIFQQGIRKLREDVDGMHRIVKPGCPDVPAVG